jgi:predicted CXXCH cytochrome family protein
MLRQQAATSTATPTLPAPTWTPLPSITPEPGSCGECHPDMYAEWYGGFHSPTHTSHVIEESMDCLACHPSMGEGAGIQAPAGFASSESDGKMRDANCVVCHTTGYDPTTGTSKAYGITCDSCHTASANHPDGDENMVINQSNELCGRCHSDTRFNWDNWQNSKHYQEDMRCVDCHDPHSTSLHNVGTGEGANKSDLCLSCHKENEHISPYSVHGRAGVTCVDCHLGKKTGVDTFHVVPNHSFNATLDNCNNCHEATIHMPADEAVPLSVKIQPRATFTPHPPTPTATPQPLLDKIPTPKNNVMWLGFAAVVGLIGLVIGVAMPDLIKTAGKLLPKKKK